MNRILETTTTFYVARVVMVLVAFVITTTSSGLTQNHNPLDDRGYKSSRFMFEHQSASYFYVRSDYVSDLVVAVHDVEADEPFLTVEHIAFKEDGSPDYSHPSSEYVNVVTSKIIPWIHQNVDLSKRMKGSRSVDIHHYTKGIHIPFRHSRDRSLTPNEEEPVLRTSYVDGRKLIPMNIIWGSEWNGSGFMTAAEALTAAKQKKRAAEEMFGEEQELEDSKKNFPVLERDLSEFHLIYDDESTAYYVAGRKNSRFDIVAVHKVDKSSSIVDTISVDIHKGVYDYSDAYLSFLNKEIVGWLERQGHHPSRIRIEHYHKHGSIPHLKPSVYLLSDEKPILTTIYSKKTKYERRTVKTKIGHRVEKTPAFNWSSEYQIRTNLGYYISFSDAAEAWKRNKKIQAQYAKIAVKEQNSENKRNSERIVSEIDEAQQNGYVFKSMIYWSQYHEGKYHQRVFLGRSDDVYNGAQFFRYQFNGYVAAYSKFCRQHLPAQVPIYRFGTRSITYDGFGSVVSDTTSEYRRIYVHPRFAKKYDEYLNHEPKAGVAINQVFGMLKGQMPSNFDFGMKLIADMEQFVKSEGCDSATTRQFRENLLRIAEGRETIQESGERVEGAARESMTISKLNSPKTLLHACMAHRSFDPYAAKWCACIDRAYEPVLSSQEKQRFISDYAYFSAKKIGGNPSKKDADFEWRLFEPAGQCKS